MIGNHARRSGFSLIEVLVTCLIAGILMSTGISGFKNMREQSTNAQVFANTQDVRLALQRFYADHDCFPTTGLIGVDAASTRSFLLNADPTLSTAPQNYLPGNWLPPNPFGPARQLINLVALDSGPFLSAETAAAGTKVNDMTTSKGNNCFVGPGTPPNAAYTTATFGAIVFDTNPVAVGLAPPRPEIFTLYGVGKKGLNAVVVSAITNSN